MTGIRTLKEALHETARCSACSAPARTCRACVALWPDAGTRAFRRTHCGPCARGGPKYMNGRPKRGYENRHLFCSKSTAPFAAPAPRSGGVRTHSSRLSCAVAGGLSTSRFRLLPGQYARAQRAFGEVYLCKRRTSVFTSVSSQVDCE